MRRREHGRDEGSVAVNLLIALVFTAAVVAALYALLGRWYPDATRQQAQLRLRGTLDLVLEEVAAHLAADPTPQSDSPIDPVWHWLSSLGGDGTESAPLVTIEDVSSRINPNWIRKGLFDKTSLSDLFSPDPGVTGSASASLQQLREDNGFFSDLELGYGSLFSPATQARYLTVWSYANINLTDEFALRRLYELRTGDPAGAELFHTRIQRLLQDQRVVGERDLKDFLQADYDRLFPAVNALPWWNVHYLPPLILRQILAYPDYHVSNPVGRAERILSARDSGEIGSRALHALVGLPAGHIIYQYLGTQTWFRRVMVTAGTSSLSAVLCRLPSGADAGIADAGIADAGGNPFASGNGSASFGESSNAAPAIFRVVSRKYRP